MLLLQGSHPGSQPGSSTKVRIRIIRGRSLLFLPVYGGILCRLLIRDCKKQPMRTISHLIRGVSNELVVTEYSFLFADF